MKRRLAFVTACAGVMLAAGCGPYADQDLSYDDVDTNFLANTVVVVASSRSDAALRVIGSTLFVRSDGSIQRIDNAGLEEVSLAYEGGQLGFSDRETDFVLGPDPKISMRESDEGSAIGNTFYAHQFVSVLAGTSRESNAYFVSRPGQALSWLKRPGRAQVMAECGNGVWVAGALPPGEREFDLKPVVPSIDGEETGSGESAQDERVTPALAVRRAEPESEAEWIVNSQKNQRVEPYAAACARDRFVAIAKANSFAGWHEALVVVNVNSGTNAIRPITGHLVDSVKKHETVTLSTPHIVGTDLYTVAEISGQGEPRNQLLRIDIATGESTIVAHIKSTADISTHFRFSGDVLHVLDVTWRDPSSVRAYRLSDGIKVGSFEFDWLEPEINGRFTTSERTQHVRDFVVLQPENVLWEPVPPEDGDADTVEPTK